MDSGHLVLLLLQNPVPEEFIFPMQVLCVSDQSGVQTEA